MTRGQPSQRFEMSFEIRPVNRGAFDDRHFALNEIVGDAHDRISGRADERGIRSAKLAHVCCDGHLVKRCGSGCINLFGAPHEPGDFKARFGGGDACTCFAQRAKSDDGESGGLHDALSLASRTPHPTPDAGGGS
jgi:hypothetical protein